MSGNRGVTCVVYSTFPMERPLIVWGELNTRFTHIIGRNQSKQVMYLVYLVHHADTHIIGLATVITLTLDTMSII